MTQINEKLSKIETTDHFVYCYQEGEQKVKERWLKGAITDVEAEKELKSRLKKTGKPQATTGTKTEKKALEPKQNEEKISDDREVLENKYLMKFGKKAQKNISIKTLKEKVGK